MRATGLERIKPIKTSLQAADVPSWADIISTTPDGGFLCRIKEVPRTQMHHLPEYVEIEKVGERESPGGDYTYPVLRKHFDAPEVVWKLEPRPNGRAVWNRTWQESPEEQERAVREERRRTVMDTLADRLASSGAENVEAAVDRLLGEVGLEPTPVAEPESEDAQGPPEVEHNGFVATMDSPGRWTMPDGTTVRGSKDDALDALKAFEAEVTD